jgi:lipopolysaccharide/colanic/teichoic acid biosynthesis glycosyltransferase
VGKFLRRTGFDDLVQLINIFKGVISLVYPPVLLDYQIEKYSGFDILV